MNKQVKIALMIGVIVVSAYVFFTEYHYRNIDYSKSKTATPSPSNISAIADSNGIEGDVVEPYLVNSSEVTKILDVDSFIAFNENLIAGMNIINSCVGLSDSELASYFDKNKNEIAAVLGYKNFDGFKSFISEFHYKVLYASYVRAVSFKGNGTFYIDLVYENNIKPRVVIACKIKDKNLTDFYWY